MTMKLAAMDNEKKPVDWWFMYKVAGKSKTKGDKLIPKLTGAEYVYFDSSEGSGAKLVKPGELVTTSGALPNTLNQLYRNPGASTQHLGWFFYNDEDPLTGKNQWNAGPHQGRSRLRF
jgi:hypothetical protein